MLRALLFLAAVLGLPGCLLPSGPLQEDYTKFHSAGAFDAAVQDGADVLGAAEDPATGDTYPSLPMHSLELDAAWGKGRYALRSIHWWGPGGAPSLQPAEEASGVPASSAPGAGQGFLLAPAGHFQVMSSGPDRRELADAFLENVTDLSAAEREAVIADALANCDVLGCTTEAVRKIDAGQAWARFGGLTGATDSNVGSHSGIVALGSWWFDFTFAEASFSSGWGEGRTYVTVGSNDIVEFRWRSEERHSDGASYEKLQRVVGGAGIEVPPAAKLEWVHRDAVTE